jgi:4-methylaminobutanoate oxidase (formaldehyde-forming)
MQETTVGDVPVRALRVTYVGELGWELYCPAEYGAGLWRALVDAGEPLGLRPAGYRAIESLRLEKGYRVWGADVTRDTTPDEAGLAFAVRPGVGYAGAEALAATRAQGPARGTARRLRCLVLADPLVVALGGEPVEEDDAAAPLGYVTSGGYGYTVGRSIAYALLPAGIGVGAAVQVQVDGDRVDAEVVRGPLHDPKGDRIRA